MLTRLDERRAAAGDPPEPALYPDGGLLPPEKEGALARLYLWRWIVALHAAIVIVLALAVGLSLGSIMLAIAAFVGGAALIPRAGLLAPSKPVILTGYPRPEPGAIAKKLVSALPEPAIVLAKDGVVQSFNAQAREVFEGLKEDMHISAAIRNPGVLDALTAAGREKGVETVTITERVPVERRMLVTVSFLGTPLSPRDPAFLVFVHDLTEQHRLDELRSDFIANASHEIKTPLASLVGFIETLQGAARHDADARDRFLAIMAKQAARMARLIDNLMSLSRVEMRAHLRPLDRIKIADIVAQACDALEPMASEAGITVEIAATSGAATVLGDKDELIQVFINLLHNALKYGKRGGRVSVRIERVEDAGVPRIAITVEDNGAGIGAQHLPRLTERFYRVPDSSVLERGGTGLGLAIVKHVVNRHRGELRISSEQGRGSQFTVLLSEHITSPLSAGERNGMALDL